MAQFLEFNVPADNLDQDSMPSPGYLCFCCLAQNKTMINLANCEHSGFLKEYYLMGDQKVLVCHNCHNMLKKIFIFKKQVLECSRILNLKLQVLQKTNKLYNLQKSDTMVTSNETNIEDIELQIKVELEGEDADFTFKEKPELTNQDYTIKKTSEIKIKLENCDYENNASLAQIKKLKKQKQTKNLQVAELEEKYVGKIGVLVMSTEEFMEERESESKKESYLKLPFRCESCIKGFELEVTLKKHNEMLHTKPIGKYFCNICKSVLGSENSYKKHTMRHLKRFVCMACGKRATEIYSITQHYNQQHGDTCGVITTQFECDQCEFTTNSYRVHRYHREKHKKPQCNVCGNTFANNYSLKAHVNTVHKGITHEYTCSACEKNYKTRSGLFKHIEATHESRKSGKGAYCEKCRTHYADKANLLQHLKMHSAHVTDENKRYACQECEAKFVTKAAWQSHLDWNHRKNLKFKCNKCSKAFKTAHNLKRHGEFVHEKKRPLKDKVCDYCGRAFSSTVMLISHIRTHTGERPLKCTHCSATFAHAASLYNHRKLLHNKLN